MKHIATFLFIFSALNIYAQQTPKDILFKMVANIKAHQSISYTVNYSAKEANGTAGSLNSMIHLQRDKADTVWGGMVWISEDAKNANSIYSFYDKNKTYTVMPPIGKAYGDKPVKNHMGLSIQYNEVVWADFLHPEIMERKYTKAKDISQLTDTTINGIPCYQIQLSPYYGSSQLMEIERLCITKSDYFPVLIRNSTIMSSGTRHIEMLFSKYTFDKVSPEQFSPKQIPATYSLSTRDRETPKGVQVEPRIDKSQFPLPGNRRR
jgi:outer membrane lipoprotein-sorting protein